MHYIVYKITNQINNMIYVGAHKTHDINDSYMGSGTYNQNAQKKYGIENFSKEILYTVEDEELMYFIESEIVDELFIGRNDTYNLKLGGEGGWDHINREKQNKNSEMNLKISNSISKTTKRNWANGVYAHMTLPDWTGKKHTKESKEKMRASAKDNNHQKGENNSQFGTHLYIDSLLNTKTGVKRFKKGSQPTGWITTKEWYENRKGIRRWFTDGVSNFLIDPLEKTENMYAGQTRKK